MVEVLRAASVGIEGRAGSAHGLGDGDSLHSSYARSRRARTCAGGPSACCPPAGTTTAWKDLGCTFGGCKGTRRRVRSRGGLRVARYAPRRSRLVAAAAMAPSAIPEAKVLGSSVGLRRVRVGVWLRARWPSSGRVAEGRSMVEGVLACVLSVVSGERERRVKDPSDMMSRN